MTRETKIGLLVGLAFIIVIGILLSDYNRNEIQGAPLPQVADTVRAGVATPHNGSTQTEIVPPPAAPAAPAHPVLTPQDLHRETIVEIGAAPGGPTSLAATRTDERPVRSNPPVVSDTPLVDPVPPTAGNTRDDVGPTGIPGTEYVGAHNGSTHNVTPAHDPTPTPDKPTVNGAKQYVAIDGDTVSKLAGRFLGGNTKTNREAIMAINPSLKANPNNVIVGRTYMIPAAGTKPPVVASAGTPAPARPVTPAPSPTPAPTPAGPHYFYTVKDNDNLWKIAAEQLGDGNAYAAIKELNKDILKGGDNLRPNMRLRLPAKPVASTN